jgi:hypothetical protein
MNVVCPGEVKRRNPTMRAAIPLISTSHQGQPGFDEVAATVVMIFPPFSNKFLI